MCVVADRLQAFVTETARLEELRRQRSRSFRNYERKRGRFGFITAEEERERWALKAEDVAQQLAST